MLDTLVKAINECDIDNEKIEEYIIFADDEVALNISFIFKKFNNYVINRIYKENALNNYMKKIIFEEHCKNNDEAATALFCLGEICFEEDDRKNALNCFVRVVKEYKDSEKYLILTNWAEKNIIDLYCDYNYDSILQFTDIYKSEGIYKLEYINTFLCYIIFKNINDEKTIKKLIESLSYIAENEPSYRDTLYKGIEYIEKCGEYKNAYQIALNAYGMCKNKKFLNISADNFCKIENTEQFFVINYDEHIKFAELLKDNNMFIEYINVLFSIFKFSNEFQKCTIIEYVEHMLKSIKLNSSVLKKSISVYILLKEIYNYINKNKFNNLELNKYENDFARYLFYVSYVTDNRAELYESYTNFEVNNNNDSETNNILKLMKEKRLQWGNNVSNPYINDFREITREGLKIAEVCPFINEFNYLKCFVNEGDELYEKLSVEYEKNKSSNFNIMVYGIFSAGKSAFINSILGDDILEEGALPTTSVFTYISNSEKNMNIKSSIDNIPYKEVIVDNEFLENITLIDTPGFEDSDKERGNLSTDYVNMADAFIILIDATKPLTISEYERIKYIKENTTDLSRIVFVVNKIDFIDDEDEIEEVIEYTKAKLKELFEKDIEIYEYSAYFAKDGVGNYKDTIINVLKNLASFDKCTVPFMILKNYKLQAENYIKNEYNKKTIKIIATIKAMEGIVKKINKFQSFLEVFSKELCTYLNNQYVLFENNREAILKKKAAKIVTDAIEDAKISYDYSEYPDKIYDIVNEKINEEIEKYLATTYKINVSNAWYEIFRNIKNYLEEKEKMFNYNLNEFIKGNILLSKKYSQTFMCRPVIDEIKNIADIVFKYSEYEVYNNTFIKKPEGMAVGFKRFFKGNYDIVLENISNIENSYDAIVIKTKIQFNSRMYSLGLSIKALITGNINEFKGVNFKFDGILEKYDFIKREDMKFIVEPKYLDTNFIMIDRYSGLSKNLINQIETNIDKNKRDKTENEHSYNEDLKRLSFMENDIKKYSNQIKRGIVYVDGELYRTN